MKRTCPWCLEPLSRGTAAVECPNCGSPLGDDAEPKAFELRCAKVEAAQAAVYRRLLAWGTPIVAVIAVAMPFLHLATLFVVPLVVAAHLVVVRVVLAREAQRLLRPVRRLLSRWLTRFAFLWIGIPGYGAMAVPVLGMFTGVGTFALLTSVVHVSTAVSLERERSGKPLARWEKVVPMTLAAASIGLIVVMIAVVAVFGWSVMAIVDRMQSP